MTTRRMIYWWFRFVMSGRFLDRFLSLPHTPENQLAPINLRNAAAPASRPFQAR